MQVKLNYFVSEFSVILHLTNLFRTETVWFPFLLRDDKEFTHNCTYPDDLLSIVMYEYIISVFHVNSVRDNLILPVFLQ
jgi:hypothetical protein